LVLGIKLELKSVSKISVSNTPYKMMLELMQLKLNMLNIRVKHFRKSLLNTRDQASYPILKLQKNIFKQPA
jgi:hypothetical protein